MIIDAKDMSHEAINRRIRENQSDDICIRNLLGQRYIANGSAKQNIRLYGTAGNNLGSFLDGSHIELFGNAQETCGDTMNAGSILIHGHVRDALGYGMRGGKIFVRGNCGSRCGIHMKAYKEKVPLIIIGGCAKDFLGEYMAGGTLIVLNLNHEATCVGKYCGSGAHGGHLYLRLDDPKEMGFTKSRILPIDDTQKRELHPLLMQYAQAMDVILPANMRFYQVKMADKNPYEGLYTEG